MDRTHIPPGIMEQITQNPSQGNKHKGTEDTLSSPGTPTVSDSPVTQPTSLESRAETLHATPDPSDQEMSLDQSGRGRDIIGFAKLSVRKWKSDLEAVLTVKTVAKLLESFLY